ncbi:hypothetical protein A3860_02430 [Niastella vici]|uniref:Uncharacterized protein n=1 Tax=Niastella vici TaxID=1703345 RepID=A0A1V9G9T9_9BACT|nr:hypothetical protein [Niastella vici]OQP67236.1 hypothetical protein A3860_02430 [Niastella vici]
MIKNVEFTKSDFEFFELCIRLKFCYDNPTRTKDAETSKELYQTIRDLLDRPEKNNAIKNQFYSSIIPAISKKNLLTFYRKVKRLTNQERVAKKFPEVVKEIKEKIDDWQTMLLDRHTKKDYYVDPGEWEHREIQQRQSKNSKLQRKSSGGIFNDVLNPSNGKLESQEVEDTNSHRNEKSKLNSNTQDIENEKVSVLSVSSDQHLDMLIKGLNEYYKDANLKIELRQFNILKDLASKRISKNSEGPALRKRIFYNAKEKLLSYSWQWFELKNEHIMKREFNWNYTEPPFELKNQAMGHIDFLINHNDNTLGKQNHLFSAEFLFTYKYILIKTIPSLQTETHEFYCFPLTDSWDIPSMITGHKLAYNKIKQTITGSISIIRQCDVLKDDKNLEYGEFDFNDASLPQSVRSILVCPMELSVAVFKNINSNLSHLLNESYAVQWHIESLNIPTSTEREDM